MEPIKFNKPKPITQISDNRADMFVILKFWKRHPHTTKSHTMDAVTINAKNFRTASSNSLIWMLIPVYLFIVFLIGVIFYTIFFIEPTWWVVYLVAVGISALCGQIFGLGLYTVGEKPSFELKKVAFKKCMIKGWYFAVVCFVFLVLQIKFDLI